jgi:hypothetical protein
MHAGNIVSAAASDAMAPWKWASVFFPPPLIYIDIEVPRASAASVSVSTGLNLTIILLLFLLRYRLVASSKKLNGNTATSFVDII